MRLSIPHFTVRSLDSFHGISDDYGWIVAGANPSWKLGTYKGLFYPHLIFSAIQQIGNNKTFICILKNIKEKEN